MSDLDPQDSVSTTRGSSDISNAEDTLGTTKQNVDISSNINAEGSFEQAGAQPLSPSARTSQSGSSWGGGQAGSISTTGSGQHGDISNQQADSTATPDSPIHDTASDLKDLHSGAQGPNAGHAAPVYGTGQQGTEQSNEVATSGQDEQVRENEKAQKQEAEQAPSEERNEKDEAQGEEPDREGGQANSEDSGTTGTEGQDKKSDDKVGREDTTDKAGDVAEGSEGLAEDAAAKSSKGKDLAQAVGGEVGRGVGEGTAGALGADEETQEMAGDVGEEGGSAAGGYLYDKYGNKVPASGGGAGGAGSAGATGQAATAAQGATAAEAGTAGAAGAGGTAAAGAGTAAATTGGTAAAGTAAATGGAEAVTIAGAGAAGAAETAGVSLAVAAAAIAAQEAKKQADKKTPQQKAMYAFIILTLLALPLIIILITVSAVVPRISFDKDDPVSRATISSIETMLAAGKIKFTNKREDLEKIKSGEIGKGALETINNLGKSHEQISIHYTGIREYAPGLTKANDSFEFDITSVDKIKCTDTANGTQLTEFPIYLNLNYDWKSLVLPSYSDKVICAVGYYPTINSPTSTTYKDLFSPGEFPIQELPERAKMAVQEKSAELIDEIISQDRLLGIDSTTSESLLPMKISLDSALVDRNYKQSTTLGISVALSDRIKQAYKTSYPDKTYNPLEKISNYNGLHVSYL